MHPLCAVNVTYCSETVSCSDTGYVNILYGFTIETYCTFNKTITSLTYNQLINSLRQSHSSESNSHSATKKFIIVFTAARHWSLS